MNTRKFSTCKALVFDLMGTCCDWKTGIVQAMEQLPPTEHLPAIEYSDLALEWRAGFFREIHSRFEQGLPQEDIDITHRRVLDQLLEGRTSWPDAIPALNRLRKKYFLVVLANGTTRLQLDIAKSSGLPFHTLFSSQLLELTKPDLAIYHKAAELMSLSMSECVIVAAHAYDLRAAKEAGMRTVYVRRETEDVDEDFEEIERFVDLFVDGRDGTQESGLAGLASSLVV